MSGYFRRQTQREWTIATYVHRRDSDKTYASCWLARVSMPKAYSDYRKQVVIYVYTYHHHQGLKPGDISRKLQQEGIKATGQRIAMFLAKFIESGSVARKPGSGKPSQRNGLCNGTEQNGPFYAVFRKTLSPCNANRMDRF